MQIRYKPEETPVTLAAKNTYLGRVYLSWAQYPITEAEPLGNDPANNSHAAYAVHFRDLRYDEPRYDNSGQSARGMLGATVFPDPQSPSGRGTLRLGGQPSGRK